MPWPRHVFPVRSYVEGLIGEEAAAGIPSDKVIVAGFSQGGAVAMMGARSSKKLAAIIGVWPLSLDVASHLHLSTGRPPAQGGVGTRRLTRPCGAGMSTYMPLRNEEPIISPENMATPILMCHGERDMVVRAWSSACQLLNAARVEQRGTDSPPACPLLCR